MRLIGLTGSKGSGKDTAFLAIQKWAEERGVLAVRRAFADKLKLSAARIFDPEITLEDAIKFCDEMKKPEVGIESWTWDKPYNCFVNFDNDPGEENGLYSEAAMNGCLTGREFLQRYGTEAHRDVFGENFWVDQLLPADELSRIRAICGPPDADSENKRLPDFVVITDVRFENEATRIKQLGGRIWKIHRWSDTQDDHASEKPLDQEFVDLLIANYHSIDEFNFAVRAVMTGDYHMSLVKGIL